MRHAVCRILALMLCLVPSAHAQRVAMARSAYATQGQARALVVAIHPDSQPAATRVVLRAVTGTIGFFAGTYVGFLVADATLGPCECDDPGLDAVLYGFMLGGPAGAALGAAVPAIGGECSFATRFGRAIGGSMLGMAVGVMAGMATNGPGFLILPLSTSVGAALTQRRC